MWVDNGNSWVKRDNGQIPDPAKVISEDEQIAALIPQVWERCIYVSCGRKIIPGWQEMPDVGARYLRDELRKRIRGAVPRPIMVDDCWLGFCYEIKFTQSYDRYHFGCRKSDLSSAELTPVVDDLARRLGKLLADTITLIFALDYPWKEVWGEGVDNRSGSKIVSSRSLYGEAAPPIAAQPSSGGYPAGSVPESGSGGYPAPAGTEESMATADVRAQLDRLNRKSAAASSRLVSFEPAGKIKSQRFVRRRCQWSLAQGRLALIRTTDGRSSIPPTLP